MINIQQKYYVLKILREGDELDDYMLDFNNEGYLTGKNILDSIIMKADEVGPIIKTFLEKGGVLFTPEPLHPITTEAIFEYQNEKQGSIKFAHLKQK